MGTKKILGVMETHVLVTVEMDPKDAYIKTGQSTLATPALRQRDKWILSSRPAWAEWQDCLKNKKIWRGWVGELLIDHMF